MLATPFYSSSKFDCKNLILNQTISSGLQGLSKLKYLNLSDNSFIGDISGFVNKMVSLEVINLNRNNMSGVLQNTGIVTNQFDIPYQLVQLIFTSKRHIYHGRFKQSPELARTAYEI